MGEPEGRVATLDLSDDEVEALLARAAALAQRELRAAREGPVFAEPPSAQRPVAVVDRGAELPQDGEPLDDTLEACAAVLAAGRRTTPGFFGYVHSPPSPVAVAADLLASAADQNLTAWRSAPAATEVEHQVVRWLGELTGFASDAAGLLVGGGSAANLTAALVALRARTERDADRRRLVLYASTDTHFSVAKACAVVGVRLGSVAVDREGRLDPGALRDAVARDRAAGLEPFCAVATAGAVATGVVDDLTAIADVAAEHGLWFHVDGAYGAPAAADPASRDLFAGIERADSLAVDPHKWLYVPVDCGALLVRDPAATGAAFGAGAGDYVRVLAAGDEAFAFWEHGLELSRRFRALKVWMTLRHYGARRIAAAIAEDIAMAAHLAALARDHDELEVLAGPSLSICCLRHVPRGMADAELDAHNERLLAALQRDGRVYLSNATVGGRFALRACITNFRTTRADVERAVDVIVELGDRAARG